MKRIDDAVRLFHVKHAILPVDESSPDVFHVKHGKSGMNDARAARIAVTKILWMRLEGRLSSRAD